MRKTSEILQNQIDYIEKNVAWKWEIQQLQNKISTLQHVLIESGILADAKGLRQSIIVVDGEPYSIIRDKKWHQYHTE